MREPAVKRASLLLALPCVLLALQGCSGQPPATTADNQHAKEQEAQQKMQSAFENDPTLRKPGAGNAQPHGAGMSPGPIPGQGGATPSPGPVPGGG